MQRLIDGTGEKFCKHFIIKDSFSTNIVTVSCLHPKNKCKFLYHLLISFGSFKYDVNTGPLFSSIIRSSPMAFGMIRMSENIMLASS